MADLSVLTQEWVAAWDSPDPRRAYVQRYTAASTSWTAPTGVTTVQVELWGGGGTGGTAQGNPSFAGGGAGGQYAITPAYAVTPGNSYTVAVAQVKTSVLNTVTNGDDSTFNTTGVVAKGGTGAANASGSTGNGATGSTTGGVGTTVYAGGTGGNGVAATISGGGGGGAGSTGTGSDGSGGTAGQATSEEGGAGGAGVSGSDSRNAGASYGGGGSGGCAKTSSNRRGGDGAAGLARLTWTLPLALAATVTLEAVTLSDSVSVALTQDPTVELREGATVRATRTLTGLTTSWATTEFALTTDERNAITDWAALRVAIIAHLQPMQVSWVELYAPVSSAGATLTRVVDPETLTLSETDTRAACDERATPEADTLTVSDVDPAVAKLGLVATPTADVVTLSDVDPAVAKLGLLASPTADVVTVSDVDPAVAAMGLTAAPTDTVTLGEVDPAVAQRLDYEGDAIPCPVSDTAATLSDSAAGTITPIFGSGTDTVTVGEVDPAEAKMGLTAAPVADAVTVGEDALGRLDLLRQTASDTLALTDEGVGAADLHGAPLPDLLTVADEPATLLTPEEATVSDTLTWNETGTDARRTDEGELARSVTDTVTLTDAWVSLDVELREGATVIARRRLDTLTTTWTTFDLALTTPERAAVTNWGALRVALIATGRQAQVSWVEIQLPVIPVTVTATPDADPLTLTDAGSAVCDLNATASETLTVTPTVWATMRPAIRVFAITFTVPLIPDIPLEGWGEETIVPWEEVVAGQTFYGRGVQYISLSGDSAEGRLSLLRQTGADTLTLGEAGTTVVCDVNVEAAESVTLGETVVAEANLDAEVSETLTVGETGTDANLPDMGTWQEETVTVTVAAQVALDPLWASIADQGGLTLTEAGAGVLDPLRAPTSETLSLSDDVTATTGLAVQDALTLGEAGQVEYWQGIRVTDLLTVARVRPYGAGDLWVDEWLALADVGEAAIDRMDARVADGVYVEDRPNGETTGPYIETRPAEATTVGSGGQVEVWRGIALTDQVEAVRLSDTWFGFGDIWVTLSDEARGERPDLHVQDAVTWSDAGVVDWYDITVPLTLTEVVTVVLTPLEAAGSDPLSLSDVGDGQMVDLATARQDGLTVSDQAGGEVEPVVVVGDLLAILDAPPRAQRVEPNVWSGSGVDSVTLGDLVQVEVAIEVARIDTVTVGEAVAVGVDPLETATRETSALSDGVVGVVDPELVEASDTLTLSDEVFRLHADASEALTLSETVTVTCETVADVEVPGARVWRVPAEARTWRVEVSERTWGIDAEPRTWRVPAEDRTWRSEEDA